MNFAIFLTAAVGIAVLATLIWTLAKKPERSAWLTGVGIAGTFITGLLFTMLVPSFNNNWSTNTSEQPEHFHNVYNIADFKGDDDNSAKPLTSTAGLDTAQLAGYTPLQAHGRLVYQREGCVYCHSQQIRPLENEMKRYSIGSSLAVPADGREYIWDQPHFLGTRRIGPDLSREGGKYSDDWHYSHFYYPRQMFAGSVMPAFTWLFDKDADGNPVPNADARALVAYVQTLGYGRLVPDGSGGWRSWLSAQDQQYSQRQGATAVLRAATPVYGGDKASATNKVLTPKLKQ